MPMRLVDWVKENMDKIDWEELCVIESEAIIQLLEKNQDACFIDLYTSKPNKHSSTTENKQWKLPS
jgi:hypothetical protein